MDGSPGLQPGGPLEATATATAAVLRAGGAGRIGGGRQKPHPCVPRFAPSMARVHVIAFALPLPRFASQTVGPVSPAPTPRRFAAAPDSGAPSTRRYTVIVVAPSRARRNVSANGPLRSPTMGRRYRFSLFSYAAGGHGTCQGAGRWGWAGALSAMDGAKRGTQEQLLPSPDQSYRPAQPQQPCSIPPRGGLTRSTIAARH